MTEQSAARHGTNERRRVVWTGAGMAAQDGAGVTLTRIIGQPRLPDLDPFLMLDEFGSDDPDAYIAGFPDHPHRGFETVTYMLAGAMRHHDNKGNVGHLGPGSIQWMTAGRGIVHSEMPEQQEGLMRGFQLWINLPAKDKLCAPRYQDIAPERVLQVALAPGVAARSWLERLLACADRSKAAPRNRFMSISPSPPATRQKSICRPVTMLSSMSMRAHLRSVRLLRLNQLRRAALPFCRPANFSTSRQVPEVRRRSLSQASPCANRSRNMDLS
jgi:hypothetical protein